MKTEILFPILLIIFSVYIIYREIRMSQLKMQLYRLQDSMRLLQSLLPSKPQKADLPHQELHQYRTLVIKVEQHPSGFGFKIYTNDMKKMIINSWDTTAGYNSPTEALNLAQKYIDINITFL